MEEKHLKVAIEGKIMWLTLNRPEALNALSANMRDEFMKAFDEAKNNPDIRVLILSGEGRAFCTGGDVKGMGIASPVGIYNKLEGINTLIMAMTELEKPIIAAVHGYAAGAGVCLAMACDQILAADDSKFVLSFAKVGLISDGGGLFFLPRTLGVYRAKELFFNADPIDAAKAMEWGMVNRIYPAEELRTEALKYAQKIASGPSKAFGMMKKIANRALTADLAEILEVERTTQAMIASTKDHKEGVAAFKEKRKPAFTGE
ncbi:MAG: enoyl-CoA hydratase-related protein [Bacillota bacterium]|nr:enoyl-CoA hydratase-related protein [Bacillota bacterium]